MQHPRAQKILLYSRITAGVLLLMLTIASAGLVFLLKSKEVAFTESTPTVSPIVVPPFPVGVNPHTETIAEQPSVDTYLFTHFAYEKRKPKVSWLRSLEAKLLTQGWYQNLASPQSRVLVIYAGERKEEVTDSFGDILRWNDEERTRFETLVTTLYPTLTEGVFFPGTYTVPKDAAPDLVAVMVLERFEENIMKRYTAEVASQVTLEKALVVASLLEREAYSFEDMRIISGVIWNRLFSNMKLQLDATLQYAHGSNPHEAYWWPPVDPQDKYLDSPYNTYQNEGLPPAPIANPSAAAVLAALNPIDSDCRFYFHDSKGALHCSKDYEQHIQKLKSIYGRGK